MSQAESIAANLRRLRQMKNLSQEAVAREAGISRPAYRNIETGRSVPRVATLQSLARALKVSMHELVAPTPTLRAVRFRALKRMTSRDHILVDVARWLQQYGHLEQLLERISAYHLGDFTSDEEIASCQPGEERAVAAAKKVRELLELDEGEPVRDICGLLENSGIKVYPRRLASDSFFGLSVAESDGGPAIVVNVWERISVERWIFSAAHELGHLVLHLDSFDVTKSAENDAQETEANIFASYFLMPDRPFRREWSETGGLPLVDRVLKVKRIFQVSYKTVLYRLALTTELGDEIWRLFQVAWRRRTGEGLKRKDEPEPLTARSFQAGAVEALKSAPESLRSKEPDHLSRWEFVPDRLDRLVREAVEQGVITLSRGAEILGLDLKSMREREFSWLEI